MSKRQSEAYSFRFSWNMSNDGPCCNSQNQLMVRYITRTCLLTPLSAYRHELLTEAEWPQGSKILRGPQFPLSPQQQSYRHTDKAPTSATSPIFWSHVQQRSEDVEIEQRPSRCFSLFVSRSIEWVYISFISRSPLCLKPSQDRGSAQLQKIREVKELGTFLTLNFDFLSKKRGWVVV